MATITERVTARERADAARSSVTLHSGDRLDRKTFHELYLQTPEGFKAELINGVVYVASPVSRGHSVPNGTLVGCFFVYEANTPGVERGDNGTVFLTPNRDEVQPDAMLMIRPEYGGAVQYAGDGDHFIAGGPELVVEVATSSAAIDLHDKRDAYERAGVREYVVLSTKAPELFWYENREGRFVRLDPPDDGIFRSTVFPGLWLNAAAIVANDSKTVLETVQAGLADPAHEKFIAELARRKAT